MKPPQKGKVKTRLAKEIGEEEALAVYEELVMHTIESTTPLKSFYQTQIFLSSNEDIDKIKNWLSVKNEIIIQKGGNLGERLSNAFQLILTKYDKAVVIGTDAVNLSENLVSNAFEKLNEYDLVIGPTFDGGYYLLGMKHPHVEIFKNIDWSTSLVLSQTLKKAKECNLTYFLLEKKRDIDTLKDLKLANFSNYSRV
ncbi:MAG: TIGR04282 family arsenosugar biosynthesis glycosyltransferase [Spirochaetia bacterium]|nr:TIGR04282 family arsenosugar biosynthesis glycosyltransferase [Spirochaetia bacterium]